MGTRSITTVRSRWVDERQEEPEELSPHAHIYRHWDGYLDGHGQWLADFLEGFKVGNGGLIGDAKGDPKYSNGPGQLTSMLISKLHVDGHEPDIQGGEECPEMGQEFHYVIDVDFGMRGGVITVTVFEGPMTFFGAGGDECNEQVFRGSVEEYLEWLPKQNLAEDAA